MRKSGISICVVWLVAFALASCSASSGNDTDQGEPDSQSEDTGALDSGPLDSGPADTSADDAGPPDTGPSDLGMPNDLGTPDDISGPGDIGPPDDTADAVVDEDSVSSEDTAGEDTDTESSEPDIQTDTFEPECALDDQCVGVVTPGICEVAACQNGTCVLTPAPDGKACDDGDSATGLDVCTSGSCGGTACDCEVPSICCDGCFATATGESCTDDGISCTDDVCESGECAHPVAAFHCLIDVACYYDGQANPNDACRYCDSVFSQAVWRNKIDGTACTDANPCTVNDTCSAGTCASGAALQCDALDSCHVAGQCNPGSGECDNPPAAAGISCDDGNPATGEDSCNGAGLCLGANCACNTTDACCDGCFALDAAGECSDDGLWCTTSACAQGVCQHTADDKVCVIDGACVESTTVNPESPCMWCNPAADPVGWSPRPDDTACSDNNPCTQVDTCLNGTCVGTNTVVCPAPPICHGPGACQPDTGECSYPPSDLGKLCDDNNKCTSLEKCDGAGSCVPGKEKVCPDAGQCYGPSICKPNNGTCQKFPLDAGTPCDDGNPDTGPDSCSGNGQCLGASCLCNFVDGCCDGCQPKAGTAGNPCNGGDLASCQIAACDNNGGCATTIEGGTCLIAGTCYDVGAINPANDCEVCGTNSTAWSDRNGESCDDGDPCTEADICTATTCAGETITDWGGSDAYEFNDGGFLAKYMGTILTSPKTVSDAWFGYANDADYYYWTRDEKNLSGYATFTCRVTGLHPDQTVILTVSATNGTNGPGTPPNYQASEPEAANGSDVLVTVPVPGQFSFAGGVQPNSGQTPCYNDYILTCTYAKAP